MHNIAPQDVPAENAQFRKFKDHEYPAGIDQHGNHYPAGVDLGAPDPKAAKGSFPTTLSGPRRLPVANLHCEPSTQARTAIDPEVVQTYSELMAEGVEFPAVSGYHDGAEVWIYDGHHRIAAAKAAGFSDILVAVKKGTRQDAEWEASRANSTNGLHRKRADIHRAIDLALKHPRSAGMSDAAIAKHIGTTDKTVAAARKRTPEVPRLEARIGLDGKTRKAPNSGKPKVPEQERAAEPDTGGGILTVITDSEPVAPAAAIDPFAAFGTDDLLAELRRRLEPKIVVRLEAAAHLARTEPGAPTADEVCQQTVAAIEPDLRPRPPHPSPLKDARGRLTAAGVAVLKDMLAAGVKMKGIAERFGIAHQNVKRLIERYAPEHLNATA